MTTKTVDQASARKQPELERLSALVGTWDTEGTHPALPGVIVRGSVTVEWLRRDDVNWKDDLRITYRRRK